MAPFIQDQEAHWEEGGRTRGLVIHGDPKSPWSVFPPCTEEEFSAPEKAGADRNSLIVGLFAYVGEGDESHFSPRRCRP